MIDTLYASVYHNREEIPYFFMPWRLQMANMQLAAAGLRPTPFEEVGFPRSSRGACLVIFKPLHVPNHKLHFFSLQLTQTEHFCYVLQHSSWSMLWCPPVSAADVSSILAFTNFVIM